MWLKTETCSDVHLHASFMSCNTCVVTWISLWFLVHSPMMMVWGEGGMAWAACQLDLQLSCVLRKGRDRICVCVIEGDRDRERLKESQQTAIIDLLHPTYQFIPVTWKVRCAFISTGQMEQSYGASYYLHFQLQVMVKSLIHLIICFLTVYVCITRAWRYFQQWYDSTLMEVKGLFL